MNKSLRDLKEIGKIKCNRVYTGKFHSDNHNEFKEHILSRIKEEVGNLFSEDDFRENDNYLFYRHPKQPGREYNWRKPKIQKQVEGFVEFRSKDYIFYPLEGDLSKRSYGPKINGSNLTEYGFKIEAEGGDLEYHLLF